MKPVDVIIFGGQSNMQGQSERLSDTEIVENAYEYKWLDDSFQPLKNPVGEDIRPDGTPGYPILEDTPNEKLSVWHSQHALGSACYRHTNLVPSFCKTYGSITGRPVVAVHAAKGSTEIANWLPGTNGYRVLAEKSAAAIRRARETWGVGKVFIVWLQGESDAIFSRSKEYYKEKISQLNDSLKTELGIDKFGVIRIGHSFYPDRDDIIIAAQDEICRENPDFLMLTTMALEMSKTPECMNPKAQGHYSAASLEKLGDAAARTLAEYVCGKR